MSDVLKYIGIDWGEKRIGLAFGESGANVAVPHKVVSSLNEVIAEIKEEEVDCVVLGKPVKLSGSEENMTDGFSDFLKKLRSQIDITIELIDERLTSLAADARIGDKKTKAPRDSIAAMEILQSYLDKKRAD